MQLLAKTAKIIRYTAGIRIPGIAENHAVVDPSSATKILGSAAATETQMIVSLPGVKTEGTDIDSLKGQNSFIIWVLKKGNGPTAPEIVELEEYLHLLELMDAVLENIREGIRQSHAGGCSKLAGLDIVQIVTTAGYNEFGGWNGWCSTVVLK